MGFGLVFGHVSLAGFLFVPELSLIVGAAEDALDLAQPKMLEPVCFRFLHPVQVGRPNPDCSPAVADSLATELSTCDKGIDCLGGDAGFRCCLLDSQKFTLAARMSVGTDSRQDFGKRVTGSSQRKRRRVAIATTRSNAQQGSLTAGLPYRVGCLLKDVVRQVNGVGVKPIQLGYRGFEPSLESLFVHQVTLGRRKHARCRLQ